ncbi:MAG: VOC family protein [Planctomycetota bacterium]|nr:VOC family protein [Planctomycetota bacterium]
MDKIVVEKLDHVTVNVTDVERAKGFYGGLFGLKEVPRPKSFGFGGAWYDLNGTFLHLVQRPEPDAASGRHFAVWTADVQQAARAVEAAGYPVKWDKLKIEGVDRFFTQDPDGNRVEVQGSDA